jgi:hypothetical protein
MLAVLPSQILTQNELVHESGEALLPLQTDAVNDTLTVVNCTHPVK